MIRFFIALSFACFSQLLFAQTVTGSVKSFDGTALAYSTIEIAQREWSTTANFEGKFSFNLPPGNYVVTCQHVGFGREQKSIEVVAGKVSTIDFVLTLQQLTLSEVTVKRGEDPAYEIIRNAIKKRSFYRAEVDAFTTEVYTKGQMRLRDFPKKFMGQKVDFEDGDTSKQKVVFLSETISNYAFQKPNLYKTEVIASKVSGQSDGFGLSAPQIISFYDNNIQIGSNLNPRGFISPIADNALSLYRYKYEGAFFEEGKQISRIKVIPKRKFEPLFSGTINIIEDEWRIHSLQLMLTKSSGMELIDTLKLEQLYVPTESGAWVVKNQVLYPAIKMFGFDGFGSFVNVYSAYNLSPTFKKGFFNKTILKYNDSANKKPVDYWTENRPILLQPDEENDYFKKDSLEQLRGSAPYLDSIDRKRNKITLSNVVLTGVTISRQKKRTYYSFPALVQLLSYNTVEGVVINFSPTIYKKIDTSSTGRKSISITPQLRWGFSNKHINPSVSGTYTWGKQFLSAVSVGGGSGVFQFNNAEPVGVFGSTLGTLVYGVNNLKIYEARYANINFKHGVGAGITVHAGLQYQNRIPLENTAEFTFAKSSEKVFTPNYPLPQFNRNIQKHQAFISTIGIGWQPGTKYIEYPERTVSISSGAPRFLLTVTKAFKNVLRSDVAYTKWLLNIKDEANLKLLGSFHYSLNLGGFLNKDSVAIPDYVHYLGNMSARLSPSYLDRFQLKPHYYLSNTASFYTLLYAEHHFNGFITNKFPLLKALKWNLVAGANILTISNGRQYVEPFVGLENIFKIIRVDYIWGFEKGTPQKTGFRIGIKTPFINIR